MWQLETIELMYDENFLIPGFVSFIRNPKKLKFYNIIFKVSRRKFLMLIGLFLPFTDWLTDNINAFQSIQLTNSPAKLLRSFKNQIIFKFENMRVS